MDSRIAERSSSAELYDLARFADTPQCLAIQTNQQKLIRSFDLSSKAISISGAGDGNRTHVSPRGCLPMFVKILINLLSMI
jgi:hypothetical protein